MLPGLTPEPLDVDSACRVARAFGIMRGRAVVVLDDGELDAATVVLIDQVPEHVDAWQLAADAQAFGLSGWAVTVTPAGDLVGARVVPA